jgi:hypothetical protein
MTDAPLPIGTVGSELPADAPVVAPKQSQRGPALGHPADTRRLIESFGISHTGNVRKANEDHFVTAALHRSVQIRQTNLDDTNVFDRLSGPRAYLYAVADGVGGSAGGRVASAIAVATIVEYLGEVVGAYNATVATRSGLPGHVRTAVERAHEHLRDVPAPGSRRTGNDAHARHDRLAARLHRSCRR